MSHKRTAASVPYNICHSYWTCWDSYTTLTLRYRCLGVNGLAVSINQISTQIRYFTILFKNNFLTIAKKSYNLNFLSSSEYEFRIYATKHNTLYVHNKTPNTWLQACWCYTGLTKRREKGYISIYKLLQTLYEANRHKPQTKHVTTIWQGNSSHETQSSV